MKALIGIIIALFVAIIIFFIIKSIQGVRYWNRCEKEYDSMRARSYSDEEALLEISKKRHPELSENTHTEIIEKFNAIGLLVNFLTGALPDGKVEDKTALEILRGTTIQYQGPGKYKARTSKSQSEALVPEDNFTLIAMNTTKYYLELSRQYEQRFRNRTDILAAAGLLDAGQYFLIEHTIEPTEIIDLARKSSQTAQEPLVDFIVNLEIRIFEVDSPELDVSEIRQACFDERDRIRGVIERTRKEYVSESVFASATSSFMNSAEFKQFRKMIGIKD